MRVERGVAEVGLGAVAALEVASLHVVLAAALPLARPVVVVVVILILLPSIVVRVVALGSSPSHALHSKLLALTIGAKTNVGHAGLATLRKLAAHKLAFLHVGHLVAIGAVSVGPASWLLLVHALSAAGHHLPHRVVHVAHLACAHPSLVVERLGVCGVRGHVELPAVLLLLTVHQKASAITYTLTSSK